MKYLLPVAAVISMAAAPAIAAGAPQVDRSVASTAGQSEFGGRVGAAGFLIGLLALAAIIAGILAASKGKDRPNSP